MTTIIIIVATFRCHSPGNGDSNLKFLSAEDFTGITLHALNVTCNSREVDCLHFHWTEKTCLGISDCFNLRILFCIPQHLRKKKNKKFSRKAIILAVFVE